MCSLCIVRRASSVSVVHRETSIICHKWQLLLHPWANFNQTSQEYCLGDSLSKELKVFLINQLYGRQRFKIDKKCVSMTQMPQPRAILNHTQVFCKNWSWKKGQINFFLKTISEGKHLLKVKKGHNFHTNGLILPHLELDLFLWLYTCVLNLNSIH